MALAKTCSFNGTGSDNHHHHHHLPALIPYEFDDNDDDIENHNRLQNGSSPSTANSNEFLFQSQEDEATDHHHSLINFRGGFVDSFLHGNNDHVNNGSFLSFQSNTISQQKEAAELNSSNWVGNLSYDYEWMNEKSMSSATTSSDIGGGLTLENNNNTASNFTENNKLPADHWLYSDHHDMLTDEPSNIHKRPHMGESNVQAVIKKQCNNASKKPKPKLTSPAKDPQSIAAKNRRERISERLKILQELVPNGSKVDLVTMLEKAISYVKFLQLQVKVLATDEFWPVQGGKAPDISQVKEAIDAILHSSQKDGNSSSSSK